MIARRMPPFRLLCLLAMVCLQTAPFAPPLRAAQAPPAQQPAAELTATLDDLLLSDDDANGAVSGGDTLRYTLDISHTGSIAAAAVRADITLDPNTTVVPGSLQISPLAFSDAYTTSADTVLTLPAPGVLANDSGTPAPSVIKAANLPTSAGGRVTLNADGSFSYTPPSGFSGSDSFAYSVINPLGEDSGTATITVTAPAAAVADSVSVQNGAGATVDVLANDSGAPPLVVQRYGATAETVGATLPGRSLAFASGIVVQIAASGTLTVDASALALGSSGTERLFYTMAANDGDSATAEITISYGDVPLAVADTAYTTTSATPLTLGAGAGLLANDTLGAPAATVQFFGGGDVSAAPTTPAGGTVNVGSGSLTVNADGSFSFTPDNAFRGRFQFMYRLANTLSTSDALVEITVQAAPSATDDGPYSVREGATLTIAAAANDLLDNDDLGFPNAVLSRFGGGSLGGTAADNIAGSSVPLAGGMLTVNADGSFSLTNPSIIGSYTFDYLIENPLLQSVATVTITVEAVPAVSSTTPADNAANVALNSNISITFSKPVQVNGNWFTIVCTSSGTRNVAATTLSSGPTTFTINPTTDFAQGETCSVTLDASLITDVAGDAPPNTLNTDYGFSFTTDVAPQVNSTFPADNAVDVAPNTTLSVIFSEAVDVTGASFSLSCDGAPIAFAVSGSGSATITLNPVADLPDGATCTLTVIALEVRDSDAGDPPDQLAGNVSVSFQTRPVARDDAYSVTPHLIYVSPSGVRANDSPTTTTITGFGPTLGAANATVPNGANVITAGGAGGRVALNADGTFRYYPDAGDTHLSGTASFFYTVSGGDTAQVTLTFEAEELLWFVDSTPAATVVCTGSNSGTQACPAGDLATVAAVDTANDIIFVAGGNYTGGITLESGMWLLGDGSSSTPAALVAGRVTPVNGSDFAPYNSFSGSDPVFSTSFSDAITLASNNTLRGITIGDTDNFAGLVGANYGTLTVAETTISGTGQILNLDTGTVNATFDSLASSSSDNSFAALRVTNSTVNFVATGGVSISGSAAGVEAILLTVNNGTGFNLGNTSVVKTTTGNGVVLGNGIAQSAPVSFNRLTVTTAGGSALTTNRQTGVVTVSEPVGSDLSATGGAAFNVINSAGNTTPLSMNLGDLSAANSSTATACLAGSPAGFCLSGATGAVNVGGLTVTSGVNRYGVRVSNSSAAITFTTVNISGMSGTTAESDFDANGFPDTNGDGDGIFLSSNTGSFTVNGGSVQNTTSVGADNVDVRSSSNVRFNNVMLGNSYKHNFQAINMTGSGSFNNGSVSNAGNGFSGAAVGFHLRSNAGILTLFDIDSTNCTMPATEGDCIKYVGEGSHRGTLDIDGDGTGPRGNFLTNSSAAEVLALGAANITFTMDEMEVSPNGTGLGGMNLAAFDTATLTFRLINNRFNNSANGLAPTFDGVIRVLPQGPGAALRGRIDGNIVDIASGASRQAIRVITVDTLSAFELLINNNTLEISGAQPAILFRTDGATVDAPALRSGDVFIENNTITSQTSDMNGRGIDIQIRDQAGSNTIRTLISNNTINTTGAGGTADALRIRMQTNAARTHATVVNNTLNSGTGTEFIATTGATQNDFCLDLRGHTGGNFTLTETAGTFTVENFATLNADNPGALLSVGAGITSGGVCSMPVASGLAMAPEPELQPAQSETVAVMLDTLPVGKRVRVVFAVQIADPLPDAVTELRAQATISSGNAATVLSDDPATAAAADATITRLGSDQPGSVLYLSLIGSGNAPAALGRTVRREGSAQFAFVRTIAPVRASTQSVMPRSVARLM